MPQNEVVPITILLVEDDPGDAYLTREALQGNRVRNELASVTDGVQAMAYLRREPPYEDAARPDLVLLDLNLPRKSGHEVLVEMKTDPELRAIPVVILTTSISPTDIEGAYRDYANLYVTKPLDVEQFFHAVQCIDDFFITVVKLPQDGGRAP